MKILENLGHFEYSGKFYLKVVVDYEPEGDTFDDICKGCIFLIDNGIDSCVMDNDAPEDMSCVDQSRTKRAHIIFTKSLKDTLERL